mmetsp:Transcript_20581/g.30160  ORF Transcript_20581/g.30160 Transcript_20581/m.30160 type:complete len:148 (+) Transcript_20581:2-445(+)
MLLHELSELEHPYILEFMKVKSYIGTESSGDVKILSEIPKSMKGRNVVIVEDIVDTGRTLAALLPQINSHERKPKSCTVCTMLVKRLGEVEHGEITASVDLEDRFVGFSIPNEFIVGMGLDYNEMYRDLMDIWVLNKQGITNGGYGM